MAESEPFTTGDTILRGIVGSTAYGLDHPGSDVDRLGMFVAPTRAFHGLHQPQESRVLKVPSDYTEHEVGKYIRLLLKCNPTVTELLWLPDELYEIRTVEVEYLIAIRRKLLYAKGVRNAYLGYATQQFQKLFRRGDGSFSADTRHRTEKHARHLMRLCWQGFTLYSTGVLPIRVEDPEVYREFGRNVATHPDHARRILTQYEGLFNETKSVLLSEPDEAAAERWLLDIRMRHL